MDKQELHKADVEIENWIAFQQGDQRAYSRIYQAYFTRLYNYGNKFTSDKSLVEDCIQDLFIRLWQNRSQHVVPASVRNYLFKSLRNILFNKITSRKETLASMEEDNDMAFQLVLSPEMDIIQVHDLEERHRQLTRALEELTQRQKEALFLKFYEGLSYEEISQVISITVKGTYKLVARALEVLHNSLKKIFLLINFFLVWLATPLIP